MKRILSFSRSVRAAALAAAGLVLLTACGGGTSSATADSTSAGASEEAPAAGSGSTGTAQTELFFLSQTPDNIGYQTCNTNGMYYIATGDEMARIRYWDCASNTDTYLCTSPNCSHDSESCTAFLKTESGAPQIAQGENCLYLFYSGYNDGQGGGVCSRIETANLDGSERATLYTFDAGQDFGEGVAGDANGLYMVMETTQQSGEETGAPGVKESLVYLDNAGKSLQTVQEWDSGFHFIVGADGSDLILKTIDDGSDMHTMDRYNVNTGEQVQLCAYAQSDCVGCAAGQWVVTMTIDGEQINLHAQNRQTDDAFDLPSCFSTVNGDAGLVPVGFYHDTLFVSSITGRDSQDNLLVAQYAIDMNRKSVTEVQTVDPVIHRPIEIAGAVGADRDTLVIEKNEYAGATQDTFTGSVLGTISMTDYIRGNDTFRKIGQ